MQLTLNDYAKQNQAPSPRGWGRVDARYVERPHPNPSPEGEGLEDKQELLGISLEGSVG